MSTVVITDAKGKKHRVHAHEIIYRRAIYGLYVENSKLLMVKDKVSNNWEIPGGGIENNEIPIQTLKREFFEETGLLILDNEVSPSKIIYSCEELFFNIFSHQAWKTKRDFFLISQVRGSLNKQGNKKDITKAQFFSFNKLPFTHVTHTIRQVLNKLLQLHKEGYISKINS